MPQTLDRVTMDAKMRKSQIKKSILETAGGPIVENKDKRKINNIINDTVTLKEAFGVHPKKINPVLRRWVDQSEGDMIFLSDKKSKYLSDTMMGLDRNKAMKLDKEAISRKRRIVDDKVENHFEL